MKQGLFSDKRGSLVDPILSSAYILKVVIVLFIAIFVWLGFQSAMSNVITGTHSETLLTNVMTQLTTTYYAWDYVFPLLVGGLMLVSVIFAYKTGTNYLWGIFSVLLWGLALLFATTFSNVYLTFSDSFTTIYTQMPILDSIMSNLNWITLFWVAVISAVMFRKNNQEDDASELARRAYGGK